MQIAASLASLVRRLRFKHLQLLDALDRSRNLHVAAQTMNLTQPAATKILHDAEELFGFPIFERRPRGMRPTKLGELVIRYARQTLGTTARFVEEIAAVADAGAGILKVGAILGAADLVAEAIGELKERSPALFVHLLARTSDQLLVELEERRLDIVVGRFAGAHQHAQFDFRSLMLEPLWVVVNSGHPLRERRRLRLGQLAQSSWILQPVTSPMRQLLDESFDLAGVRTPVNVVETISIFGTLQLLQASPAIAVLPASIARNYVENGVLVRLPVKFHRELGRFGTLTRKHEVLSPATQQFVALLSQAAARSGQAEVKPRTAQVKPIDRRPRKR
jgi:DNA-binding transcriptional LysR family regulator